MEKNDAESIRAARRKARILNNTEGRINRILGHSTNGDKSIVNDKSTIAPPSSDDILQTSNNTLQNPSLNQQVFSPSLKDESPTASFGNNSTSRNEKYQNKSVKLI